MNKPRFRRLTALLTALCLCALPMLSMADTYLPDGDVTHADFTLGLQVHADGFPASKAHLSDWETFLQRLDLRGSMDSLAMLTTNSRVYLNAALRLDGQDQLPFVYDGYHSYRYLLSPALGNEVLFFQMHNFLEFMLKPYYYMELPTQYLGLLMYPEASYYIGDSYYTPIADMIDAARQAALAAEPSGSDGAQEALSEEASEAAPDETTEAEPQALSADADAETVADEESEAESETADVAPATIAADGTLTFAVPYETLYEQCENLDLIANDDLDLERVYFYFTSMLTDLGISDMTVNTLGALEDLLATLDPDELDLTVTQTPDSMTCAFGDTVVFDRHGADGANAFTLSLLTPDGYQVDFDYAWTPGDVSAALRATLTVREEGEEYLCVSAEGDGLPRDGDLGGQGTLTFTATGSAFDQPPAPLAFAFDWARDAAALPYRLGLTVDWLHPETGKPALTLQFNGDFRQVDKSVFVEGSYEQNDFFNLNETFLEGYKERLLPTLALKLAPLALAMPSGVIDDVYRFLDENNILVSFME